MKYKRHCLQLPLQHYIPHRSEVLSALHTPYSSFHCYHQMPVIIRPIRQTSTKFSAPLVWQGGSLTQSALKYGLRQCSTCIWSWHRLFPTPRDCNGSCAFSDCQQLPVLFHPATEILRLILFDCHLDANHQIHQLTLVRHYLTQYDHSRQSWYSSHLQSLFPWFQDDWLLHYPRYQRISYRPDSSYPCQLSALSPDNTFSGLLHSKMAVLPYRIKSRITHANRVHLPYAHHSCSYS